MEVFPTLSKNISYPIEEELEDTTISSPTDAGYVITRQRYSRQRKTWTIRYKNLSADDKKDIEDFISTIDGGASAFYWTCPLDNVTYTVRFTQLPRFVCNLYLSKSNKFFYDIEFKLTEV